MQPERRARAARWLSGSGIEIGALHNPLPVPDGVEVRYVDRVDEAELRRQYRELEGERFVPVSIIGDAEDLSALAGDSVDFVIANHLLEHLENPIRGLEEMTRVLRPGGILYLALPDPRVTFDRDRELTPVEHVVREYRDGPAATREAHFAEWVERAEPHVEWMQEAHVATGPARVQELLELDYSIHFHVWRPDTFLEFLVTATRLAGIELEPVEFTGCDGTGDNEFILVLRKGIAPVPPPEPPLPSELAVRELQPEVARLAAEVARLRGELGAARNAAASERSGREAAERELQAVRASRSWRLMSPLRGAAHAARRVRGRSG